MTFDEREWASYVRLTFVHRVANDQVTGHLSLILDNYAAGYWAQVLEYLVLNPSFMCQETKIGQN